MSNQQHIVIIKSHDRCYKVWIVDVFSRGYLRQGFGWRTEQGAINAARRAYPGWQIATDREVQS